MLPWMAVLLFGAWCLLTLQTIVNLLVFRTLGRSSQMPRARVSIVIPARNEERWVGRTLDAALGQDYPDLEIIVVDDGSTDRTAEEIASRAADPRLVSMEARELAPGWLGKPNALATGASRASGKWILFMDADVELDRHAIRDAVAACEREGWDHLALFPHFERQGFWEECLMPLVPITAFVYLPSFLAFVPGNPLAVGGGAFGLVRREAYLSIGGHDRIKSSVVDDVRLAMELKRAGFMSRPRLGLHRVRLRMYHGLEEIVEGFTKNAHAGFGNSILLPVVTILLSLFLGLTPFLWPLVWLFSPERALVPPASFIGLSLGLVVAIRGAVHLRLGYRLWPILISPLTVLVGLFIVLRSLRMARNEGVVRWRGREYPRESTEF